MFYFGVTLSFKKCNIHEFFLFVLSLEMILEFVVFWRLSQFRPEFDYLSEISFYFLIGSGRI